MPKRATSKRPWNGRPKRLSCPKASSRDSLSTKEARHSAMNQQNRQLAIQKHCGFVLTQHQGRAMPHFIRLRVLALLVPIAFIPGESVIAEDSGKWRLSWYDTIHGKDDTYLADTKQ